MTSTPPPPPPARTACNSLTVAMCALAASMALAAPANAQQGHVPLFYGTLNLAYGKFDSAFSDPSGSVQLNGSHTTYGIDASAGYQAFANLAFELELGYRNYTDGEYLGLPVEGGDEMQGFISAVVSGPSHGQVIVPYLGAGIGSTFFSYDDDEEFLWHVMAGVRIPLNESGPDLTLSARYIGIPSKVGDDGVVVDGDTQEIRLGWIWNWGGTDLRR